MYIKGLVKQCDFTDREYDKPVMGVHCLAQGATGRWCCVMWMGPEYAIQNGIVEGVISREEAEKQALASHNGSVDF